MRTASDTLLLLAVLAAGSAPGCSQSFRILDAGADMLDAGDAGEDSGTAAADGGPDGHLPMDADVRDGARDAGGDVDARDEADAGADADARASADAGGDLDAADADDAGDASGAGMDDGGPDAALADAGVAADAGPAADAGRRSIVEVGTGRDFVGFACARFSTGAVRCWGDGRYGELGIGRLDVIGDDEPASAGEDVRLGEPAVQLSVGANHVCAVLAGGRVRCWGAGAYGMLGYASTANIGDDEAPSSAGDVLLGGRAVRVAAGAVHTCALLEGGRVRCWGENDVGQLGYGHTARIGDDEAPASAGDVQIGGRATDVCVGAVQSCALLEGGAVRCWGNGVTGALGYGDDRFIGDNELPWTAGDVPIGEPVVALSCGWTHTCVLLGRGRARCWGQRFPAGKLGYSGFTGLVVGDEPSEIPALLPDIDVGGPVARIRAGVRHTCALLASGSLRCWGGAYWGTLGYGNLENIGDDETPASAGDVPVGGTVAVLGGGLFNTCVVLASGGLRCWGRNWSGQLGYGHTNDIGDDETPASAGDVPVF